MAKFVINEEQNFLKDSAKDFLESKAPISLLRSLRDNNDHKGYAEDVWNQMVEMGWTGMIIPESFGGMEFGYLGFGQVAEQMGKTLTSSPLLDSAVISASVINEAGNQIQKEKYLQEIVKGKVITTAMQEGAHMSETPKAAASISGDQVTLNGTKTLVSNAHVADHIIVSVAIEDDIAIVIIPKDASGLSIDQKKLMDTRYYATIHLENVTVSTDAILAKGKEADLVMDKTVNIANIFLAAELLGISQEAFDRTLSYLKERTQFGKIIGTFQGLQHRAAIMFNEIEILKTLVFKGLQGIDEQSPMLNMLASMAKAKACKTAQLVTNEGIQMYGGIGMTDDEEIGFFLKRARVAMEQYGNQSFHVDRYARCMSY